MLKKHPLFWKDWRSFKWWSLLIMTILMTMLIGVNSRLGFIQEAIKLGDYEIYEAYEAIFSSVYNNYLQNLVIFLIPLMVILPVVLLNDNRKNKVGDFIHSLPYKKSAIFKVKWFVGFISISLPFFVFSLLSLLLRYVNRPWITSYYRIVSQGTQMANKDSFSHIILPIIQIYLFSLVLYSLFMLVQTLIANNIMAGVIGFLALLSPSFLVEGLTRTLARISKGEIFLSPHLYRFNVFELMYIKYDDLKSFNFIIPLAIIILSFLLATKAYSLNDMSKNGQLAMFKFVEVLLILAAIIFGSLFFNNFLSGFNRSNNLPYEIITLALGGFLVYIVMNKINRLLKGGTYNETPLS